MTKRRVLRSIPVQVAKDCAFSPLALAIAGSTPLVVDTPSSASAWRKLHEALGNATETQRSQEDALDAVLVVGFEELGKNQRNRFLKLAVLANGVLAPTDMLCHLWDEEVCCQFFCCQTRGYPVETNRCMRLISSPQIVPTLSTFPSTICS